PIFGEGEFTGFEGGRTSRGVSRTNDPVTEGQVTGPGATRTYGGWARPSAVAARAAPLAERPRARGGRHRLLAEGLAHGRGGQRLLRDRRAHAERLEHALLQQRCVRYAGHVLQHLLRDGVAATGVAPERPGLRVDPDRRGVRRRLGLEHLHGRRYFGTRSVAREAMHGDAGGVGKQAAQRNGLLRGELVRGHLPGAQ